MGVRANDPAAADGAPTGGGGAFAPGDGRPAGAEPPRADRPGDGAAYEETGHPGQPGTPERSGDGDRPARTSRRAPAVTRDTARPEGGGRAAPGDAPAPARQWPLLTVLGLVTLGLFVVGVDPFPQAHRVGTLLIGLALLTGAALRRALPSVGMLAVRSRFTDMATYGLLGVTIVLFSLMTQPEPWLRLPFLEEAVRFAVR